MPLALPDQKHFEGARGYVELGMFLEASEELEKSDSFNRVAPEVLALPVDIYRGLQKSELMRESTERLYDEICDRSGFAVGSVHAKRPKDYHTTLIPC